MKQHPTFKTTKQKVASENVSQWQQIKNKILFKMILLNGYLDALHLQKSFEELQNHQNAEKIALDQWLVIKKLIDLKKLSNISQQQQRMFFSCQKCGHNYSFSQLNQMQSCYCPTCKVPLIEPPQLQQVSLKETIKQKQDFGNYLLLGEIARGGMGIVYRAKHKDLEQIVALKVMKSFEALDQEHQDRFKREIRITNKLKHPNIVTVHDAGQANNTYYYTMEFIEGQNLADIIKNKPFKQNHAARLLEKIARAIHYAHEQNIIHRDLKPENILMDQKGEPHITDLGLAKDISSSSRLTKSGTSMGTPMYMSPEQVDGKKNISASADVYALGVILYELLTQKTPFEATSLSSLYAKILTEEPAPPRKHESFISPVMESIVLKAIARQPEQRYKSAKMLADDLKRFRSGKKVYIHQKSLWTRWGPKLTSQNISSVLVVILTVVVLWQKFYVPAQEERPKLNDISKSSTSTSSTSSSKLKIVKKTDKLDEKDRPQDWPLTLWKKHWDHKNKRIDFSTKEWLQFTAQKQSLLARSYRVWYAKRFSLPLEQVKSLKRKNKEMKFHFCLIPPGCFWMGSPRSEKGRKSDERRHRVAISKPFYLGKYEITQKQWIFIVGKKNFFPHFRYGGLNLPMETISAQNAKTYCKYAGFNLPTEAQWEHACRAGTTKMTYIGDFEMVGFSNAPKLSPIAWYAGNSGVTYRGGWPTPNNREDPKKWENREIPARFSGPHPVGQKLPNSWGLHDMIGNAWEWCSDWYRKKHPREYYKKLQIDPTGPKTGVTLVSRGGAWGYESKECRSASRICYTRRGQPSYKAASFRMGMRVAVPVEYFKSKSQ